LKRYITQSLTRKTLQKQSVTTTTMAREQKELAVTNITLKRKVDTKSVHITTANATAVEAEVVEEKMGDGNEVEVVMEVTVAVAVMEVAVTTKGVVTTIHPVVVVATTKEGTLEETTVVMVAVVTDKTRMVLGVAATIVVVAVATILGATTTKAMVVTINLGTVGIMALKTTAVVATATITTSTTKTTEEQLNGGNSSNSNNNIPLLLHTQLHQLNNQLNRNGEQVVNGVPTIMLVPEAMVPAGVEVDTTIRH